MPVTFLSSSVRSRAFIMTTVVGPILLAGIISLAFGGGGDYEATIGIVDEDGSAMTPDDRQGVQCGLCHRLLDPMADPENPAEDAAILAALTAPVPGFGNAMMVVDPLDRLRGPFDVIADNGGTDPHGDCNSNGNRNDGLARTSSRANRHRDLRRGTCDRRCSGRGCSRIGRVRVSR